MHIYLRYMIDSGIVPEYANSGYHILLVEKDSLQGYLLQEVLAEAGWVVCVAEKPEDALRLCEHELFDVALINSCYPEGHNGFRLGELLLKHYSLPSLMVTASRYVELERNLHFNARQKLLFKPYHLQECVYRLREVLALSFAAL